MVGPRFGHQALRLLWVQCTYKLPNLVYVLNQGKQQRCTGLFNDGHRDTNIGVVGMNRQGNTNGRSISGFTDCSPPHIDTGNSVEILVLLNALVN